MKRGDGDASILLEWLLLAQTVSTQRNTAQSAREVAQRFGTIGRKEPVDFSALPQRSKKLTRSSFLAHSARAHHIIVSNI
jgi:hypothetical protein